MPKKATAAIMRPPPITSVPPIPHLLLAGCLAVLVCGCDVRDEAARPIQRHGSALLAPEKLWAATRASSSRPTIEYVEGYEAGCQRLRAERKPMLVVFRAGWCRFSSEMMQGALLDPQIVELSRQCICVMVDADRSADTCRALGIQGFPTVLVVAPNGKETFRTTGRPSVQAVAAAMQHVLEPARMAETDEVTSRTQNF